MSLIIRSLGLRLALLVLPFFLVSCAYIGVPDAFKNRDKNYLRAQSVPPLKIPPGLSSDAFQNTYPVPDRHYPAGSADISLLPPGLMGPSPSHLKNA